MRAPATVLPLFLLLLVAVHRRARGEDGSTGDKSISERCMHELGLTTESLYSSFGSTGTTSTSTSTDDIAKCVDACLLKSYGIMRDDGTFRLDTVMKLIADYPDDEGAKRKIVETCARKGDNDCDAAHDMLACMSERMKLKQQQQHQQQQQQQQSGST